MEADFQNPSADFTSSPAREIRVREKLAP